MPEEHGFTTSMNDGSDENGPIVVFEGDTTGTSAAARERQALYLKSFGTIREYERYDRARERAALLAVALDPELAVSVDRIDAPMDDLNGSSYDTFALRFTHATDPYLHWTMEISSDDNGLDQRLPELIERIYHEHLAWSYEA
ncbi:MAG TPA: hypothetical protein VMC43_00520 [Candidatus Paceibacterota bacterium]|nr:hypothetical protein [Candidatus Paceibacterota bacterium]